ncbi:MAG: vWA domain-containing protein [Acidobacteriota bacterium]
MKCRSVLLILAGLALAGCASVATVSTESNLNKNARNQTSPAPNDAAILDGSFANAALKDELSQGIYIIFDASGSMLGRLPDKSRKLEVAKKVLKDFVAGDFAGYELALRVYGHRQGDDCADSELVVPFGAAADVVPPIEAYVDKLNALGRTPITLSFQEALKDFGDRSGEIILISDGIESCNADPCALMREWKQKNVKIKVHVVGLGLDEKSRQALKCISDAAGTEYLDAQSATTLAESLSKIRNAATSHGFRLQGVDAAGNPIRVSGMLSRAGAPPVKITSYARYQVEAGDYNLVAGVLTANGNLYQPAKKSVTVAGTGQTVAKVEVTVPPRVKAKFVDKDQEQRGSQVTAFQNGKEVFKFRAIDEVFLDEGTYEFHARPNAANELSVTESFAAGDRKEILFGMAHTVKVTVKMIASGSGIWFRENYELWQNGQKKYDVHQANGALVVPGTYDVRLANDLTPYLKSGIVITDQNQQHFDITVPVGHVTFVYQRSDGTADKDDRCFVSPASGNQRVFTRSGQKVPLTPGKYQVEGWSQKGRYDSVAFEIKEGEDKVVTLRAK